MEPVNFYLANDILSCGGMKDCIDLIIHRGKDPQRNFAPVITSAWQMSPEQLIEINRTGGLVFFTAWGGSHPPMLLNTFNPIKLGWFTDDKPLQAREFDRIVEERQKEYKEFWATLPIIKMAISKEILEFLKSSFTIIFDESDGTEDGIVSNYIINGHRYQFQIV